MSLSRLNKKSKSIKKANNGFTVFTTEADIETGESISPRAPPCISVQSSSNSTGFGSFSCCSSNIDKPKLSGRKHEFPMWKIRAEAYFTKLDLDDIIFTENPDPTKNKLFYLELVTLVDNEALQMIASNAPNDGKRAYELLCQYYLGDNNARMVNALHQLSLLRFNTGENIQQFICRCDVLRTTLKSFNMSSNYDSMLVINALNALPDSFKIFKTIINTAPILATWDSFKMQLLNHVSIENANHQTPANSVMHLSTGASDTQIFHKKPNMKYKKFVTKQIFCTICKTTNNHHTMDCDKYVQRRGYTPYPRSDTYQQGAAGRGGSQPQNTGASNYGRGRGRGIQQPDWNGNNNRSNKNNNFGSTYKGKRNQYT